MTFELFISRRYFKSKPKQTIIALITLLSIIGVAIGVTSLIVVIGVMAGFETDLKTRIMAIEPHLVIQNDNQEPINGYAKMVAQARQTPGVLAAWPVVELQVMLRSQGRVAGAVIKGVDPLAAKKGLAIQSLQALAPDTATTSAVPQNTPWPPIVLGRDLARTLGLIKGDTLFAVSPRGTLTPVGFVPLMKRFVVVDFFETGMYTYDGSLAFMRLADAQILAHTQSSVSQIEIRIAQIFQATNIGQTLVSHLGPGLTYRDWMQLNKNLFSALKLEKAAMFITLTLIILVATFSITSSLVMLVMEKTKDIAILKALGATARSIQKLFVLQGMFIGLIGTTVGVVLGSLLCYLQAHYHLIRLPGDVYYITALPVDLKLTDIALVALAALAICFVATLYPAQQAARLNPVEAIRYG
jgi:lipoprotein-releasing system permease protein